jgi:hypothetical protein
MEKAKKIKNKKNKIKWKRLRLEVWFTNWL